MSRSSIETRYGVIPLEGVDVVGVRCQSVDLRNEIDPSVPNQSILWDPGKFEKALFHIPGEHPVGEIITRINGVDVHIVWEDLGRPGVVEISMSKVLGILGDKAYAAQWAEYLVGSR